MLSDPYFFDVGIAPDRRSTLYPIKPEGLGSGKVESLGSYVCRVANAHKVSPYRLCDDIIEPLIVNAYPAIAVKNRRSNILDVISGVGPTMRAWVGALSTLTTRSDLPLCTLSWLENVIAPQGLVLLSRRYCPVCLLEHSVNGSEPFDQLIWQVQVVTACPIHAVRLREQTCHAAEHARVRGFKRCASPGHCSDCGSIAYRCNVLEPEVAKEDEIWIANQVAAVLAYGSSGAAIQQQQLVSGLKEVSKEMFDGKLARLANHCGFSNSTTWRWLHDPAARITLVALVQISASTGYSLLSLLKGEPSFGATISPIKLWKRTWHPIQYDVAKVRLLRELEKGEKSASLNRIARDLGIRSAKSLRDSYPDLCAKIVDSRRKEQELVLVDGWQKTALKCKALLRALEKRNLTPTLRNVEKITGYRWSSTSVRGRLFTEVRNQSQPLDETIRQ